MLIVRWTAILSLPVQVAIRALGFEAKKAEVQKIMKECDREGSGKICYQDFLEISE